MPDQFELPISFPVDTSGIDKANEKLSKLADSVDKTAQKIGEIGNAATKAAGQTAQSINQAMASAAQAAQEAIKKSTEASREGVKKVQDAYSELLKSIQAANKEMGQGKGPGGGGGSGGGGGGSNSGGSGFGPGFGQPINRGASALLYSMGLGGGAYAGAYAVREIGSFIKDLLPQASQAAAQLRNLSMEMGLTTQETYKLQTAAKLIGVDLGTMGMAARRLSEAIEEPGTAGKQAAKGLTELGVSLRQSVGDALEETISRLGRMTDETKRAQLAGEIFSRYGATVNIMAENMAQAEGVMNKWGLSMENGVQKKLQDANMELQAFDARWTLLKAHLAEGVILPIITNVSGAAKTIFQSSGQGPMGIDGGLMGAATPESLGFRPFVPMDKPEAPKTVKQFADISKLSNLLVDKSKESIHEQLSELKFQYSNDLAHAKADKLLTENRSEKAPNQKTIDLETQKISSERAQIETLEARLKVPKSEVNEERYLNELRDRALMHGNQGIFRPIGELEVQRANRMYDIEHDKGLSAGRKQYFKQQFGTEYDQDISFENSQIADKMRITEGRFNSFALQSQEKDYRTVSREIGKELGQQLKDYEREARSERSNIQQDLSFGQQKIQRESQAASNIRRTKGDDNYGLEYQDEIALAQKLLSYRQQEISLEQDSDKRQLDAKRALYEYISEQDTARLKREEQIATIGEQQKKEAGQFMTGLFHASISGQPSAGSNFFHGVAMKYADTMISNITEHTFGTMESKLTLQRDPNKRGVLGTGDSPNWLGQMLKGTPFGFDPAKSIKHDPLTDATAKNTELTAANTKAIESNSATVSKALGSIEKMAGVSAKEIQSGAKISYPQNRAAEPGVSTEGTRGDASTQVFGSIDRNLSNISKAVENTTPQNVLGAAGGFIETADRIAKSLSKNSSDSASRPLSTGKLTTADQTTNVGQPFQPHPIHVDTQSGGPGIGKTISDSENIVRSLAGNRDSEAVTQKNNQITTDNNRQIQGNTNVLNRVVGGLEKITGIHTKRDDSPASSGAATDKNSSGNGFPTITVSGGEAHTTINSIVEPINKSLNNVGRAIQTGSASSIISVAGGFAQSAEQIAKTLSKNTPFGGNSLAIPAHSMSNAYSDSGQYLPIAPMASMDLGLGTGSMRTPPDVGITPSSVNDRYIGDPGVQAIVNAMNRSVDRPDSGTQEAQTAGGISKTLGSLIGGAQYGVNGYGLGAVLTGQAQIGDGAMKNLSTSERVGAGLALGGQVAGGIAVADQGFSRGGAKGDLQGIAGIGAAIAPFTGPAAPIVAGVSALVGMIGSLFPDPREQRIKQEAATMTHDAFVGPAAKDYNFSGAEGGAGFSLGYGSSLQAGGPNANYSISISAMDARSFVDWSRNNPQAFSEAMLIGLQQGGNAAISQELSYRSAHSGFFG